MIEVEKKFKLEADFFEKIKREGTFLSQKKFLDAYYDTSQWLYTMQNMWLRKREKNFELKVAVQQESGIIDRYNEITDPIGILKALKLRPSTSLPLVLKENKITAFCSFWTDRRKYQLGEFIIDIDTATFDDLTYCVAEAELLVSHESGIFEAEEKITRFLEQESVDWRKVVQGKLPYFLARRRPEHYSALVNAKVIRE